MSGFLERLVAGSRRTPSIRPILGSVFTAPRDVGILEEVTSEAFGETFQGVGQIEHRKNDVITETRRVDAAEESAVTAPPSEISPSPSSLETTRDDRQSNPIVRQKVVFEPLVTRARPAEESNAPSAGVTNEAEFIGALETGPPPQSVSAYRPLVVENPGHSSETAPLIKPSGTFFSGGIKKTGQELPRRSEVATREPDEIQIHIGRIEVVAVPQQQAARAPAKSTRKSVSLDEYLKRGRSGG